ncbi:hypothetical protein [Methyloglobulus sp.]|uniref:hypothetical protein n=1 Tax=Methyloglobulus sp. TaxID=2518622 RepID=UPI00398A36FE
MINKKLVLVMNSFTFLLGIVALAIVGCKSSTLVPVTETLVGENGYEGSVFKELKAKVWEKPYNVLPSYQVDKKRVHSDEFVKHSARTVDVSRDLIESDRSKIVHPNGICLSGVWSIAPGNADNAYTGYFANGSKGLLLARLSTAGTNVDIDEKSSLGKLTGDEYISYGFTGKIFPTVDAEDPRKYRPANFITQTDLGGQPIADISDVEMLNAPHLTVLKRGILGGGVKILAITGRTFESVDESNTIRQVYEIAELDKPSTEKTNTPQYLKLVASPIHRKKLPKGDFRKTLQEYIQREKQIAFDIFVANEGYTKTFTKLKRETIITDGWKKLGTATFYYAVNSQACDFNLHFHHPAWRKDRNDPSTVVRH